MKQIKRILGILLALVGSLILVTLPTWAQEPLYLRTVEPSEGRPGEEMELTIWGGGFKAAGQVQVNVEDIEVLEVARESDQMIVAYILIREDAPPGPRPVEVVANFGPNEDFRARLDEAFTVVGEEPLPAPERPLLYSVEPREVEPGTSVELTLLGDNFSQNARVSVKGRGVTVRQWRVVDPSQLVVRIAVADDAEPGTRLLAVETEGGRAELREAIEILEQEGAPVPWAQAAGAAALLGLGAILGRALTLRTRFTWKEMADAQWQLEASTELPEPKRACTWACRAQATTQLLKRWRVTAVQLTPLPMPSGKTPRVKRVRGDVLDGLSEAAHPQYLLESEVQTQERVEPVVDALLAQIETWETDGLTPASIKVDAKLARTIKCAFELHHCEKGTDGLAWTNMRTWKRALHQPGGQYLGILRGPMADEEDFQARAREELEGFLLKLIKGVRFKL
jgi:hypothetical protein